MYDDITEYQHIIPVAWSLTGKLNRSGKTFKKTKRMSSQTSAGTTETKWHRIQGSTHRTPLQSI